MSASKKAKKAGLKSLTEVAEITGDTPQNLSNYSKKKPKLYDVILLGCMADKEAKKHPPNSHWFCQSCDMALNERDVTLSQYHGDCGNPAKWVDVGS